MKSLELMYEHPSEAIIVQNNDRKHISKPDRDMVD